MANFLETARACVARGWYVIPCYAETKNAAIKGGKGRGWRDSFNTERQVTGWWNARPDCNVAIACGPSLITILDVDHGLKTYEDFLRFKELMGLPDTYTVRTGRRFNKDTGEQEYGVQMYFAGSVRSIDFMIHDCCGQVRSENHYVMAAGSVHPDSKEKYEVIMGDPDALAPIPDCVRTLEPIKLKAAEPGKPMEKIPEGAGRHAALTSFAGTVRNKGFDKDGILAQLIPANDFMCAVPVSLEDLEHIAESVGGYALPQPDPIAVINGAKTQEPEPDEFEAVETTARPVYPDDVWTGTPYGDFADYCTEDNFIRKRFFTEALRTVVGAVVGSRLSTDCQGVNARAFTLLMGPPGSGKGTAITAARRFVEGDFDSQRRTSERPLLWEDNHDPQNWCWPSRHIGAHIISPASAPGLIEATKPHKLEKGEPRNPMEVWRELPRFITIQEEVGGLFANFANENSGRGLETAILELYDRDSFTTTTANGRPAKSGKLLYSILGGIPKTEWDKIFARASSVGSGLFSRLNIIGTENDRTVATLPEYDFGEMQRVFLPRISALERTPAHIPLSPNGRALLNEWFVRLSDELKEKEIPAARLNTHALRVALHLAWLCGHANILESDVDAGIKVADFQAKMREHYSPTEGETREAQWEARIMKVMRAKRSLPYRELQKLCNAPHAGTGVWERAIAGLKRDGRIAVVEEETTFAKRPWAKTGRTRKLVKLLKIR